MTSNTECTTVLPTTTAASVVELMLGSNQTPAICVPTENVTTDVTLCNTPPSTVVVTTDTTDHRNYTDVHNNQPSDEASTLASSESFVLLPNIAESESDLLKADITRWETFYDQLYDYLKHKTLPQRNTNGIQKAAANYGLGSDGKLYYNKLSKDGSSVSTVLVVRDYADKVKICKEIHLLTGNEKYHNRRDKMLELIGKQYFWKGQRKDICECIASCDVCSSGLGCKRKTKPPGQARDIRTPAKISKLSTSPLNKPVKTNVTPTSGAQGTTKRKLSQISLQALSNQTKPSTDIQRMDSQRTASKGLQSSSFDMLPPVDVLPVNGGTPLSSTGANPSSLSNSFQQIFTTINEPLVVSVGMSAPSETRVNKHNSSNGSPSASARSGLLQTGPTPFSSEQLMSDLSKNDIDEEESSVYNLLFGLPSQPCDTLHISVVEAMQMALKQTVNPVALTKSCEAHMIQTLSLSPDDHTVIIAPSRAAAYIIAVSASMLKIDPLSINHRIPSRQGLPLAVLHDACCHGNQENGSLKTCTSLAGAYNWDLGDLASPMDRRMLSMAIRSNRVAAVLYQPYAYMKHCQHISLQEVCSSCHTLVDDVIVIVDGDAMKRATRRQFVFTVKEFFAQGADVILLPDTESFNGPPMTCVIVSKSSLLKQVSQNISLLQSQIALPLTCASHDLVGTVVAYKTLELIS